MTRKELSDGYFIKQPANFTGNAEKFLKKAEELEVQKLVEVDEYKIRC